MPRTRYIKPGLVTNEELGLLPIAARYLFAVLPMFADRAGRLEDRPLRLRTQIFPYDTGVKVEDLLASLSSKGFIERYMSHGSSYIQICKFEYHQHPHPNEQGSVIPSKQAQNVKVMTNQEAVMTSPVALRLDPRSLILDPRRSLDRSSADRNGASRLVGFDAFWASYPRRVSKAAATRAWKKLNLDADGIQAVQDGLRRAIGSPRWVEAMSEPDMPYIPHPATWLNGRRWEDEIVKAKAPAVVGSPSYYADDDWFEECKRLHDRKCNGRMAHSNQMDFDAAKAAKRS